jgi:TP901 family phage tail tape measure protein
LKSEYTAKFRMVDEMSAAMVRLGDTGVNAIVDVEKSSVRLDSALLNTSKSSAEAAASLSKLSSNSTGAVTPSRLLADAMSDQARKLEQAAEKARNKANIDAQAAAEAKRFHESLKSQLMTVDKVTDSMNDEVVQAQKTSESLEKVAQKSEKKAKKAEEAAAAARKNASATEASAQAEEKMYAASNKAANAEQKVADALNKSEREAKEYGEALQKASGESETLGNKAANAGELIQDAFATIGVVAALNKIKDGFVSAASAAIEFESAVTGVYKTVDGTEEQLAEISSDIKEMSLVIPSSTTEIAGVAESAGQLGIATENITDFTEVMINLGESTNLSSEQAASSLAKFSNITNMSADNYENLGSAIVALGNNFATTEADIVEMSTRMASAGTLAGMSESDILGLSAAMSSVGIEAEAGGSAMSKLMTDIQVAVETGNSSLEDFASVAGVSCEQFADMFEHRAVDALYSFIDGLNDVERNGETATVILENMGISEVRLSNAVKSLANNSSGLAGAVSLAGEAWEENTALANEANTRYGTLESRLTMTQNAANNLKIAIGDTLTPTIGAFADMGTSALTWMTDFAEKHPVVVEGITGITVAGAGFIGTVTVAAAAVKALNIVTNTFNLTLSKTKVGLIIGGVATAGAAIGGLIHHFNSAEDAVEDYNGTLEQCRIEIDSTETAYANVCKLYGENSEAAKSLSKELDTLNAQYEKGGGVAEEMEQKITELSDSYNSLTSEIDNSYKSIDQSEQSGLVAIAQLTALSDKAQITNTDLDLMANYADYLNDTFNCNIEVNYDTGELTGFDPERLVDNLMETSDNRKLKVSMDYLSDPDMQSEYVDAYKSFRDKSIELAPFKTEYDRIMNSDPDGVVGTKAALDDLAEQMKVKPNEVDEVFENLEDLQTQYEKYDALLKTHADTVDGTGETYYLLRDSLQKVAMAGEEVTKSAEETETALTREEAISNIWSAREEEILNLAKAYDEAFLSVRTDLDGMFGLFEEAEMNLENTVSFDGAVQSFESQFEYFSQYEEALKSLSEIGIDNNIIEQLNPEQAVAFAEELGKMDSETASAKVGELNGSFDKLSEMKDKVARNMADVETEFSKKLEDMQKDVREAVDGMGLEGSAANAAKVTMDGYIHQLKIGGAKAVEQANIIAKQVSGAFSSCPLTVPNVSVPESASNTGNTYKIQANATGTTYSDDVFIAGDEGPELIIGQKGSKVFPADETNRIISAITEKPLYVPPAKSFSAEKFDANSETVSKKEISLDITGKGSVNIQSNMSKEQVVSILSDYIKPVLMGIVEQEIFEEGESFYEI